MSDIIIAVIKFPNDPTGNGVAHQMFLAERTEEYLNLYSVSSILRKEKRVYGREKGHYITILPPEHIENGFKVPSFIDCTKMYQVSLSKSIDLSVLSQRSISPDLRKRIEKKISEMKLKGLHRIYSISEAEFCAWNSKIIH